MKPSLILLGLPAVWAACAPAYRSSLLSLHKSIVSISSISNHEAEAGDFLVKYLESHNFTTVKQPVASDGNTTTTRFNVLAWSGDAKELSAKVILTSHYDVVPPYIPYSIEEGPITENTQIAGRGSVDAKACVASMITAVEQLRAMKKTADNDVALLFVVGEENSGIGMQTFNKSLPEGNRPFHSVIFGEPTENKLACGHKGGLVGTIEAHGLAAHSGYPEQGKNANLMMARAVLELDKADLGNSEQFGNTTLNAALWKGGLAVNIVPDKATVQFFARVATGTKEHGHEIVRKRVREVLDQVDSKGFTLTADKGMGPVKCDCDVPGEHPHDTMSTTRVALTIIYRI